MFYSPSSPRFVRRAANLPQPGMFDHLFADAPRTRQQQATRLEQDDKSFVLEFDMPGVSREQLSIGIEGNVVRIQSLETAPRKYRFAYELPQDIDVAGSTAKLEHGVLTVRLQKVAPVSRITELAIN